jgi:hypothetical protein
MKDRRGRRPLRMRMGFLLSQEVDFTSCALARILSCSFKNGHLPCIFIYAIAWAAEGYMVYPELAQCYDR